MPRLSTQSYLSDYHFLRNLWLSDPRVFAQVSTQEQWALHRYFRLFEPLTEAELLKHRKHIDDKSLPQRAGRALSRFKFELKKAAAKHVDVKPAERIKYKRDNRPYELTVRAVARPEPDVELLARALLDLAFDLTKDERN